MVPVALVVLTAALLHAAWNAVAHAVPDQRLGFFLMNLAVSATALALLPWSGVPDSASWPFLAVSVLLHLTYTLLLLRSYHLGDFGQTYPLARGTAPLLVAVAGAAFAGERLAGVAVAGVLAISLGLVVLALGRGGVRATGPAVRAALLTGLSIATYTVVDGLGVRRAGDTLGYITWLFLLQGPLIALVVRGRRRDILRQARPVLVLGLGSGVVSLAAYGLVIWAQTRGQLATVAALRECSIVFGALIGATVFHERWGPVRVLGAVIVLTGVLLLARG